MNQRILFILVTLLSALVATCSLGGILIPEMYGRETGDWQAQGIAQDIFDLVFLVPALLISGRLYRKGSPVVFFILAGSLMFTIYTFIIYTLGVHFNRFFLIYCFALAVASYTLIYLLWDTGSRRVKAWFDTTFSATAPFIYLLVFAVLFSSLWLSEILPALAAGRIPLVLEQTGLFTNPVHVIDLSFLLPGFVIVAILLRKKHPLGFLFAPAIMAFSVIMTLSISMLLIYEYAKGFIPDYSPAIAMIFFSIASLFMFRNFLNNLKTIEGGHHV
ncbi:MAG: hypothetical protein Q8919_06500 [Bacteroidota bacterium]|nr:hypothetical protein [Bacteroidota bacterium]